MKRTRWMWLAIACLAPACDDVEVADEGPITLRNEVGNATVLNSAALNGEHLNGFRTNGWSLNGWSLNGWSLNGVALEGVTLSASTFTATRIVNGQPQQISGEDLIGSRIVLEKDGVEYVMIMDDIFPDPTDPTGDVYFYDIRVYDDANQVWLSLCFDHNGQPTEAIPIANYWNAATGDRIDDPDAVTFACRDAVLAKCVEWGYRPWASVGGTSLADTHQTCTRLARADYCGDGNAHTFNGTPIDVYDNHSPAIESPITLAQPNWSLEAEWGPDGAVCVGEHLRLAMYDELEVPYDPPPCLAALENIPGCGDFNASRGAKMANRYCAGWMDDPDSCKPEL